MLCAAETAAPPTASLHAGSLLRPLSEACSCVMQEMCKQCDRPGTVWEVLLTDKSTDWKVVIAGVGLHVQMPACDGGITCLSCSDLRWPNLRRFPQLSTLQEKEGCLGERGGDLQALTCI